MIPVPNPDHLMTTVLDLLWDLELHVHGPLLHPLLLLAGVRADLDESVDAVLAEVDDAVLLESLLGTGDPGTLVEFILVLDRSLLLALPVDADDTGIAALRVLVHGVIGTVTVAPVADEDFLAGGDSGDRETGIGVGVELFLAAGQDLAGLVLLFELVGVVGRLLDPIQGCDITRVSAGPLGAWVAGASLGAVIFVSNLKAKYRSTSDKTY